jgi:hypothetical protein
MSPNSGGTSECLDLNRSVVQSGCSSAENGGSLVLGSPQVEELPSKTALPWKPRSTPTSKSKILSLAPPIFDVPGIGIPR